MNFGQANEGNKVLNKENTAKQEAKAEPISIGINQVEVKASPYEKIKVHVDLDICAHGINSNFKKVPELLEKISEIKL